MLETYGESGLDVFVEEGGTQPCRTWYSVFWVEKYLTWILAGLVAVVNLILQANLNFVGRSCYKAKNTTEEHYFRIMIIFISQYINTAIVVLLAYSSFTFPANKIEENNPLDFLVGPFNEFNSRWYLQIGSPLIMTIVFQILTPHCGMLLHATWKFASRCLDRRCSFNKAVTRCVIQQDYEDLYTGPEFILQIRFAQLLSVVFVTLSFSSGMPILYLIAAVSMFFMFWIDKILILRYLRITPGYTKWISRHVVRIMPLAAIAHMCFGFFIYSYPFILKSDLNDSWFGAQNQYMNTKRMG